MDPDCWNSCSWGQCEERTHGWHHVMRSDSTDLGEPEVGKRGTISWCDTVTAVIYMSHVCVRYCLNCCKHAGSDFYRNNGKQVYCFNLCIRHLETAKKLLNKILRPCQDVKIILDRSEKWLKRHQMRILRTNSPGQVEWKGGSTRYKYKLYNWTGFF